MCHVIIAWHSSCSVLCHRYLLLFLLHLTLRLCHFSNMFVGYGANTMLPGSTNERAGPIFQFPTLVTKSYHMLTEILPYDVYMGHFLLYGNISKIYGNFLAQNSPICTSKSRKCSRKRYMGAFVMTYGTFSKASHIFYHMGPFCLLIVPYVLKCCK